MSTESQVDEPFSRIVRGTCYELVSDPLSDDCVRLHELVAHPTIQAHTERTEAGLHRKLGRILTNAEYAEKFARGTYRIVESPSTK